MSWFLYLYFDICPWHICTIFQKKNGCYIYIIMKKMYPPGYHTKVLWQLMHLGTWWIITNYWYRRVLNRLSKGHNINGCKWYKTQSCDKTFVMITRRVHCFHDYIYMTTILRNIKPLYIERELIRLFQKVLLIYDSYTVKKEKKRNKKKVYLFLFLLPL